MGRQREEIQTQTRSDTRKEANDSGSEKKRGRGDGADAASAAVAEGTEGNTERGRQGGGGGGGGGEGGKMRDEGWREADGGKRH